MITAVIVTYNRKELLGQNIEMLLKQTISFDSIIIVDNCSTDGTFEYLKNHGWTADPFVYLRKFTMCCSSATLIIMIKSYTWHKTYSITMYKISICKIQIFCSSYII